MSKQITAKIIKDFIEYNYKDATYENVVIDILEDLNKIVDNEGKTCVYRKTKDIYVTTCGSKYYSSRPDSVICNVCKCIKEVIDDNSR